MNYKAEFKKFITSQYIYTGVRMTLACVIPAIILAQFGVLREYFVFPLATSFVGSTDQAGDFIRRRNAFILSVFSFFVVALVSSIVKSILPLAILEIFFFGILFTIIGVYGQRFAAIGATSSIVMAIFLDSSFTHGHVLKTLTVFLLGCIWYVIIFLLVSRIQPYKLALQMVGENYLDIADFLRIKAKFYDKNANVDKLSSQLFEKQIAIKNHQEETRRTLFNTRKIVNESTTTSRLLMMMFLNSIDLHEKLMTSEIDYRKVSSTIINEELLLRIENVLMLLADEMTNIGISLQSGVKARPIHHLEKERKDLYEYIYSLSALEFSKENARKINTLRLILSRIDNTLDEVKNIYTVYSQDIKLAKSLSTGIDYRKFVPKEEKLNFKILRNNFSLDSDHFRHALRITVAMLVGYLLPILDIFGLGHSYWILITIVAIMKPSYSITKSRNILRLVGTLLGCLMAYVLLHFIHSQGGLLGILLASMVLCFSFLKWRYLIAVFFMTISIFLTFNFVNPGNVNTIFKDRLFDTFIGGVIAFGAAYLIFPVWEHTQNIVLMRNSAKMNRNYFKTVMTFLENKEFEEQQYRLRRKDAIIALANLSDNFQRMLSDPKLQQKQLETVHQFVATSHLLTAYIASLSQFSKKKINYTEINFTIWNTKIEAELLKIKHLLNNEAYSDVLRQNSKIKPQDNYELLYIHDKNELHPSKEISNLNTNNPTLLDEQRNIFDLMNLIYDTAKEQRKVLENKEVSLQS